MRLAIMDSLKRWRDYSGRSTRSQFWWFSLLAAIWPLVGVAISSLFVFFGPEQFVLFGAFLFPLLLILILPPYIAVSVRRMHDVGKSGWFNLVPIYSLYLHLQPSKEFGRIPGWIFAERTALVFVGMTAIPVLTDGFSAIGGLIFWGAVYAAIRFRNLKRRPEAEESE